MSYLQKICNEQSGPIFEETLESDKFRCAQCDMTFPKPLKLQKHMNKCHNSKVSVQKIPENPRLKYPTNQEYAIKPRTIEKYLEEGEDSNK